MIKIGDFSKLAQVSVKTLHHYGNLGILEPIHVDRYTGYRYYELEQLQRINRILALKDLGFSLEQVAQLLNENLSTQEIRGMLRMKQLDLSEKLQEEQARLDRVDYRLSQLEGESHQPALDVAIKGIDDQFVLTAGRNAPGEAAVLETRQLLKELLQDELDRAGLKPDGPWFSLSSESPYDEDNLDVNLAVPINPRPNQQRDDWLGSDASLDWIEGSSENASLIHHGPLNRLPGLYSQLYGWIGENGYQISGAWREVYLSEFGSKTINQPVEQDLIEIQCPIQRVRVPVSLLPIRKGNEHIMEPTYTEVPAFKAVGISYIGKNENNEIPAIWPIFNERYCEIKTSEDPAVYGLCFTKPDKSIGEFKPEEFEYVAAVTVDSDSNIPKGMVYREVPKYKYAVFAHHGKLDSLGETFKFIYESWFPQSEVKMHPDRFDMEVYTDEFIFDSDESKFYIYVAVED